MEIAIFGAGKCGEYVLEEICKNERSKIKCQIFIDNNCKIGKDIKIVDVDEFNNQYSDYVDGVLIAVSDVLKAQEMVISLLKRGYKNIYLLHENVLNGKLPILNKNGEFVSYIKYYKCYKPILPYIEYHVSDYCNLKCKGCGHFSNLISDKVFPQITEFEEMLIGLSRKFENILEIRLMGGEPLTNPELPLFVYAAKREFPYANIKIVTNGLLLTQSNEDIVQAIRKCKAVVEISQYLPTRKMIEEIIKFAEKKQIKIKISELKTKFIKQISSEINEDFESAYRNCISKTCHFIRNGRLYPCQQ